MSNSLVLWRLWAADTSFSSYQFPQERVDICNLIAMSDSKEAGTVKVRLATFNVHGFVSAAGKCNQDRVKELVEVMKKTSLDIFLSNTVFFPFSLFKTHNVDILCLQEAGKTKSERLCSRLGWSTSGICARANTVVMSRFKTENIDLWVRDIYRIAVRLILNKKYLCHWLKGPRFFSAEYNVLIFYNFY